VATSKEQRAKTEARRLANAELRLKGASWAEIARQLSYADAAAACKDYARARATVAKKLEVAVEELRDLEVARLDRLQLYLSKDAAAGDVKAIGESRRIVMDRARLTGADVSPDVEERIRAEVTDAVSARLANHVAVLLSLVLDGLGLSDSQRAMVPALMQHALAALDPKTSRTIEGQVAA